MSDINLLISDFILEAFNNDKKYTIIRAGRQTGKTYNAFIWILAKAFQAKSKMLWVDTVQANLDKYVDRYIKEILGKELFEHLRYDRQKHILEFPNSSILDLASAEKPENIEGFSYDYIVLNEAGIILRNDGAKSGLWEKTIKPMCKNAKVKIIGTPKGKGTKFDLLCKASKNDNDWAEYHYTCYDSPYWEKAELEKLKASERADIWTQEYLGEFSSVYENSLIKIEHINYYSDIDLDDFDEVFIHADTTHTAKTTSDYFCGGAVGLSKKDNNFYILDYVLDKIDVEQQAKALIKIYQKFDSKVKKITFDEKSNNGFGYWVKKLAKDEFNLSLPIEELKYSQDKITHFTPHIPHFKASRVYLPANNSSIQIAENQLLAFPNKGINDDFVDMVSGCFDNYLEKKQKTFELNEKYLEFLN